ncbi:MAG: 4'-phosphopantetheinyl transferase superfamily protein [Arenimonas sp.]|nr:4'-phosphopantetheinyl transferase superfamily protein [Arenimonas sp.]
MSLLQLLPLADAPAHVSWLDEDERARLAQITDRARAAQYVAGHCLARQLASDLCGGGAAQWRLTVGGDGRRRLEHPQQATLYTSISHTRTHLAVAVGPAPVGVDLEAAGQARDWLALARTMFSPGETQALAGAGESGREAHFLATWTLKEAWAKRSGRGLQRQAARRCTADACGAADAEAWTWRTPDGGSLALAASVGDAVVARGAPGEARPWRFLLSGG